ncbi:MAG: hypothetical protein UR28_C0022G0008 [Candidatus Peregrinibacteria bacterium GW2011_GWF2_33_10]|nr:MAG: hypothetical protein UR28_C0022G0008 [Candidatus Peregrinibacteria bacterium GW2011_GWF2_33_10]OGJ50551.1 MAG: hypothetical protein A2307_03180 [Candidatus Peregrinibacteria bacterium RIFOXYB2_FULL_33_20]
MDQGLATDTGLLLKDDETQRDEKVKENLDIQIVTATEENFTEADIIKLMREFCVETFDPIGGSTVEARNQIRKTLKNTDDKTLMNNIEETLEPTPVGFFIKSLQRNVQKMNKLVKEGNVQLALCNGKVIGAIAARIGGKMADGRAVYEFTQAIVLPEFRKRNIYTQIKDTLIIKLRSKNVNCGFISSTENPSVIKYCQEHNWAEKTLDECLSIILARPDLDEVYIRYLKEWVEKHKLRSEWKVFINDPLNE